MIQDKYIGLGLAVSSSLAIGTSFIITKKGLMDAGQQQADVGDNFGYLRNPIWWAGMATMVVGEVANFAAYTFAPAVLVTPLGALSVLIGSVLASMFLKERLGRIGKIGCALCLIGAIVIVLHAPPDREIGTVDEILYYAVQPAFLFYIFVVFIFSVVMIYKISPRYGKKNPLVYISICSTVGSISVMAIKGFGIALKLTFAGSNQLTHPSTYVFGIVVVVCILTQMNYFNKALDSFDTSIVNPIYYVSFTTFTLLASFILFRGFNTTDAVSIISLLCGFLVTFSGVYMLNVSRRDPDGGTFASQKGVEGMPMENGISSIQTRRSMQLGRRPSGSQQGSYQPIMGHGRTSSRGDRQNVGLQTAFEEDEDTYTMNNLDRDGRTQSQDHPTEKRPLRRSQDSDELDEVDGLDYDPKA